MASISIWMGGGQRLISQDNGSYTYLGLAHNIMVPMSIWGISSQDIGSYEHLGGGGGQLTR